MTFVFCLASQPGTAGIVGVGQGTANTANGLQDSVIGVVNLPASVCNLLGADVYEIPSPDWSSGLLMTEDPLQHQISKFVGGESSYFLITVGAGSLAKALKNCKKPAGALCDDVINSADEVVDLGKGAKTVGKAETEIVQRSMSKAELEATKKTGLLRGGREGTHYVTDSANSTANRARQRLALPKPPEAQVTLEVPSGVFSKPSKVPPLEVAPGKILPGGGMERTATGKVPAKILGVKEY